MTVRKVIYWSCSIVDHQHTSRKEAELCENPLQGDEKVQGTDFEIGDKFFDIKLWEVIDYSRSISLIKFIVHQDLITIWVITAIEVVDTYTRPDKRYRFERVVYTIRSSRGEIKKVTQIHLKGESMVKNARRALREHSRYAFSKNKLTAQEGRDLIDKVIKVVDQMAAEFNPHQLLEAPAI